ncbi:hypothetical protein Btru_023141 [Bulinus truncatus]|nr:hypothetical protein Btru_023141 [Bulinus truncatus]
MITAKSQITDCRTAKSPVTDYRTAKSPVTDYRTAKSPVTDYRTAKTPVTDYRTAKSPVTDYRTAKSPVTDYRTAKSPVTDYRTAKSPVTDYRTAKSPVTDYRTAKSPVTDYRTAKSPVTDYGTGKFYKVNIKNDINVSVARLVIIFQLLLACPSQAKTVVMLSPPLKSYIIYHSNIAQALIELGHNVSLCVPHYLVNKDVPFGLISTTHDYFVNRVPFSPASDPLFFEQGNDRKSFFERVKAAVLSAMFLNFDLFSDSDIVSRYSPEKSYVTIKEIALKAEIFIAETDHILDFPRPALPNTRLVGGSSAGEARPLTGSLKTFVEKSLNGIAVVSFGGGDLNVPTDIITKMKEAFIKTGIHFVWKINWTSDRPDKILTLNWIPQNDLLGHKNTKLFISHCGKNGQYEALHHGVPILCIPIYGDQFYNADRVSTKEFGLQVDIRKTTADELANLITRVTSDPKYKSNIQKASTLYRELYKVPSKEAAYWFDHVMKYGGGYMRSSGQEMPLYQFLLLDVVAFLLFISFIVLLTLYFTVKFCLRRISVMTERKKKVA